MLGHATWLLRCLNSGGGTLPLMPIWEVESTSLLLFSQKIRPIAWSAGDLELQYKRLRFIFTLTLVARCVSLAPSHSLLSQFPTPWPHKVLTQRLCHTHSECPISQMWKQRPRDTEKHVLGKWVKEGGIRCPLWQSKGHQQVSHKTPTGS